MKHSISHSASAAFSLLALSAILFSACTTKPLSHDPRTSPCNDSIYVQLQEIPLENMTRREYEYFKEKERACNDYKRMIIETDREAQGLQEAVDRRVFWGMGISGALILLLALAGAAGSS